MSAIPGHSSDRLDPNGEVARSYSPAKETLQNLSISTDEPQVPLPKGESIAASSSSIAMLGSLRFKINEVVYHKGLKEEVTILAINASQGNVTVKRKNGKRGTTTSDKLVKL